MVLRSKWDLSKRTKAVSKILNTHRRRNLLGAAIAWHEGVIEQLSGTRSGRAYKIPGTGQLKKVRVQATRKDGTRYTTTVTKRVGATMYNASRPGEAPAVRLGQLRQSYKFRVVGPNYMERGEVGSPLDRSIWLEKGTKRMKPRPHVEPAYDDKRQEILAELAKRWDKG